MQTWFSRSEIVLGPGTTAVLSKKKVAVFGLGGVGSFALEGLARAGIGSFVLVDNDIISETNLNRQLFALHSTLGRLKTDVAKERVLDINPDADVFFLPLFYGPESCEKIDLSSFSFVLDCIDTISSKIHLIEECQRSGVPIISSMGTGNKLDPTAFCIADISQTSVCPLARVMRRELRARHITNVPVLFSREPPHSINERGGDSLVRPVMGSVSFVPPVAGMMLAGYVIRSLLADSM